MAASDRDLTSVWLETPTSRVLGQGAWVYLVDGVLVDSGFTHASGQLLRALAGRRIERVVNTHAHEDHFGNDALVSEVFGAAVYAPASVLHLLAEPARLHFRFYEKLIWGRPPPVSRARPLGVRVETLRGELQVVPTPGHSPEHVAFFEPERRWLFSGDLFLGVSNSVARPFGNAEDLAASLRRVLALRPSRLCCTHRGVIDDPLPALEAKLRFVESTVERVRELHHAGLSVRRIAAKVLGPESAKTWLLTGGDVTRVNMVRSCLRAPGTGYRQPGSVEY
jgi:glyoxylase-like metal-dependent hydrolase (beta-lactamase superfamily II)